MDRDENARELAEGMETEEAGSTAPEAAARESVASGRPSFEDAKNGNITPELQEALNDSAAAVMKPLIGMFDDMLETIFAPLREQMAARERSMRKTPSSDFDEGLHPGVHGRFVEWCDTSPLTHSETFHAGERKRPVWVRLGEILDVEYRAAKDYYNGDRKVTQWAAQNLKYQLYRDNKELGECQYYEIVNGEGSYDADAAAREREELIGGATAFLESKPTEEMKFIIRNFPTLAQLYEGKSNKKKAR